MNRLGFEPKRGRRHVRLTLEHLESRRLMAGLNVLVFTDQDGSRSLNSAVDSPAANRLVYIDSNHNGQLDADEPLAASGADGIASFSHLEPGDYWVGLAASHSAQRQTTAVVSDSSASIVAQTGAQSLVTSADFQQAWSISSSGRVTPLGSDGAVKESFELGGPVISSTSTTFGAEEAAAWALVDTGESQAALMRLDLAAGKASPIALEGVPSGYRAVGVARMGDQLVLQLQSSHDSRVGLVSVNADTVSVVHHIAVPRGKLIGTTVANQLAVIHSDKALSVSTVRIVGEAATIQTATIPYMLESAQLSADGKYLFATHTGGGLEVFAVERGLRSEAYLAEAGGPVAMSARDGRVVTASAAHAGQLIVWDPAAAWQPVSRVALPNSSGPVTALAVDPFGDQVLAASPAAVLGASLAKPSLLSVRVAPDNATAHVSLGVRVAGQPAPLPELVEVALSVVEDNLLALDLSAYPALAILGSAPLVWQSSDRPQLGSLNVSPSGQMSYRPDPNASGKDSARLKVFNGISTSTVLVSLNVASVNDPPSDFTVDTAAIAEASSAGTGAGYATIFDVDADARYLISTSDSRFYVVNGQILRSGLGQLDYETEPQVHLALTATDADNPQFVLTKHVTIPVQDSNDGPTALNVSAAAIAENTSGAAVGHVQVSDPDAHGEYVFSVSDHRFEIADGQLRLKDGQKLDYESEQRVVLTVSVQDPSAELNSAPAAKTVVVDVMDRNDAPSGLFVDVVAIKPHDAGAYVGMIDVVDEDVLDQYTFAVSDSRFVAEGNSLRLKDGESVDQSDGPELPVVVSATDSGGNVVSATISIPITNDHPFQNPNNPYDVDNDGEVYPRDVLILINIINETGPHVIEPLTGTGEGDDPMQGIYVDVNGDGALTALDVLILINQLNQKTAASMSDPVDNSPWSPPHSGPVGGVSTETPKPLDCSPGTAENSQGDACEKLDTSPAPEGEAAPFYPDKRWKIDAELETLLDELSRERLR